MNRNASNAGNRGSLASSAAQRGSVAPNQQRPQVTEQHSFVCTSRLNIDDRLGATLAPRSALFLFFFTPSVRLYFMYQTAFFPIMMMMMMVFPPHTVRHSTAAGTVGNGGKKIWCHEENNKEEREHATANNININIKSTHRLLSFGWCTPPSRHLSPIGHRTYFMLLLSRSLLLFLFLFRWYFFPPPPPTPSTCVTSRTSIISHLRPSSFLPSTPTNSSHQHVRMNRNASNAGNRGSLASSAAQRGSVAPNQQRPQRSSASNQMSRSKKKVSKKTNRRSRACRVPFVLWYCFGERRYWSRSFIYLEIVCGGEVRFLASLVFALHYSRVQSSSRP
eukprot:gene8965-6288_t